MFWKTHLVSHLVFQSGAAAGKAVAKVTEDSKASVAKPQTVASSKAAGPQAPVEEVATMKVSTDLASAPPPPSNAQVLYLYDGQLQCSVVQ